MSTKCAQQQKKRLKFASACCEVRTTAEASNILRGDLCAHASKNYLVPTTSTGDKKSDHSKKPIRVA